MKHYIMGLFALMLALTALSFTKAGTAFSARSGAYWFELDASGNQILTTTPPPLLVSDPYGCTPPPPPKYCSRAYSAYEKITGASPTQYRGSGSVIATHFKY